MMLFEKKYKQVIIVATAVGIWWLGNANMCAAEEVAYSQRNLNEQSVMALMWTQTSAEYRALCYQAYNTALEQLKQAAAHHRKNDRPLALVLDIDETVLDNSPEEARYIDSDGAYNTKDWNEWCAAAEAEGMPGATDFLQAVDKLGVEIFYVTNRTEHDGTIKNMKNVGFPQADDKHLLLKEKGSYKQPRFDKIAKDYDVVVYMGDNAGDWLTETYNKPYQVRNSLVDKNREAFGKKFIVLPNPRYGNWESAVADKYWQLDAKGKNIARKHVLKKWPSAAEEK